MAGRLDADQPHRLVLDEGVEHPDGVAAAAHAGHDASGSRPSFSRICARASLPMTDWKSRTIIG